jgi:hypothetical protein
LQIQTWIIVKNGNQKPLKSNKGAECACNRRFYHTATLTGSLNCGEQRENKKYIPVNRLFLKGTDALLKPAIKICLNNASKETAARCSNYACSGWLDEKSPFRNGQAEPGCIISKETWSQHCTLISKLMANRVPDTS